MPTYRLDRILHAVRCEPWAVTPAYMAAMLDVLAQRLEAGPRAEPIEIEARAPSADIRGGAAVIPVFGLLSHRANMVSEFSGGTSIERLRSSFREAEQNPDIGTIVLDVDSPGGAVAGVPELASEIRAASTKVIAVANDLIASAAFWLASAADEIVVTPSGLVGSIGVVTAHEDISAAAEQAGVKTTLVSAGKGKVDGNAFEPLSEDARADLQAKVDAFYGMFVADVVKGRNAAGQRITGQTVRETFQAKIFTAVEAMGNGMIDRVATLDETIARVAGRPRRSMRAEDDRRFRRGRRAALGVAGARIPVLPSESTRRGDEASAEQVSAELE